MLEQVSMRHDVKTIIQIPFSWRRPMDDIIWHFDRRGYCLVRSAYHLSKASERKDRDEFFSFE